MKFLQALIIVIIIVVAGTGLIGILRERNFIQKETKKLQAELSSLKEENKNLKLRLEYLKSPKNLVKELKTEFDFREQDERLIILLKKSTTTKTSED